MPKRSFASIQEHSELRNSQVYGKPSRQRVHSEYHDPLNISIHTKGIVGYTGYNQARQVPLQQHLIHHERRIDVSPPGYTGYIPGARSESVFGRSVGSIISAYARRSRN